MICEKTQVIAAAARSRIPEPDGLVIVQVFVHDLQPKLLTF